MRYLVISVNPLLYLISYLCSCAKTLEINNVERDSIFFYDFSINNYDKENSFFKYFVFAEDICITMIRRQKVLMYLFEINGVRKGVNILSIDNKNNRVGRGDYKLVFKHKWKDPNVRGIYHTLRLYYSGVLIHSTKLFKFIYKIDMNGNMSRRRL